MTALSRLARGGRDAPPKCAGTFERSIDDIVRQHGAGFVRRMHPIDIGAILSGPQRDNAAPPNAQRMIRRIIDEHLSQGEFYAERTSRLIVAHLLGAGAKSKRDAIIDEIRRHVGAGNGDPSTCDVMATLQELKGVYGDAIVERILPFCLREVLPAHAQSMPKLPRRIEYEAVEVLNSSLADSGHFCRTSEDTFGIVFPRLGTDAGRLKRDAIVSEIRRRVVELMRPDDPVAHKSVTRPVAGSPEDLRNKETETWSRVIAGMSERDDGGLGKLRALPWNTPVSYTPIWNVRTRSITFYRATVAEPASDEQDGTVSDTMIEARAAETDLPVLKAAIEQAEISVETGAPVAIVAPVHPYTLERQPFASAYFQTADGLSDAARRLLVLELVGVRANRSLTRIGDDIARLKRIARAVLCRVDDTFDAFAALRFAGLHAVGFDLAAADPETSPLVHLKRFSRDAAASDLKVYVFGASTPTLVAAAMHCKYALIAGDGVGPAVDRPDGIRPFDGFAALS